MQLPLTITLIFLRGLFSALAAEPSSAKVDKPTAENQASARSLLHQGNEDFKATRYRLAIEKWELLLHQFPDSEEAETAQFSIGLAYNRSGQLDDAVGTFIAYARATKSPIYADMALWEAFALRKKQKKSKEAVDILDRILALNVSKETSDEARFRRGEVLFDAGKPNEAIKSWEAIESKDDKCSSFMIRALLRLSQEYVQRNEVEKAAAADRRTEQCSSGAR